MTHRVLTLVVCLLSLAAPGCDNKNMNRKATYKVTGEVYVDGKPANELAVVLNPTGTIDPKDYSMSQATTGADGKFSVSTYEAGDGAPVGDYKLTFTWGELNRLSMSFENDKLKGKYADPDKSTVTVSVNKDRAIDMGRIDLTTE